jgi:5'-deoxynucleotidase YfbR-like HD superfamily hydrolase
MSALYTTLSNFVELTCKGRDPSHGHNHMEQVVKNSLLIFSYEIDNYTNNNDKKNYLRDLVVTVAWLHDVPDHKYDDGTLKDRVKDFLHKITKEVELILNIIDRISYSKEVKYKDTDWLKVLGPDGCFVRNIVSDADKLEALGKGGLTRVIEFIKVKTPDISREELNKKIKDHAEEKLLRLKDHFIRTGFGKLLAERLHNEFVDELNNFILNIV